MKHINFSLLITACLMVVTASLAEAGHRRRCCGSNANYGGGYYAAPTKNAYSAYPAPATTTAQAQPATGYRTYSYEPGTYAPATAYGSYGNNYSYGNNSYNSYNGYRRMPTDGMQDATWKARGAW
jgi:hypothetical protein